MKKQYTIHAIIFLLSLIMSNSIFAEPSPKKKKKEKAQTEKNIKKVLTEEEQFQFDLAFSEGLKAKHNEQIPQAINEFIQCITIDPTSAASYYELSGLAMNTKQLSDALDFSRKAVEINPQNKWYLLKLAKIYQLKSMIPHACEMYNKIIDLDPYDPDHYLYQSSLYASIEEWDKAINTLNRLESKMGISEGLSLKKLQFYQSAGKKEEAYRELEKLIEEYPEMIDFRGLLADMYNNDNQPEKAYQLYEEIIEIDPDNGAVHFFLFDYYRKQQKEEKAWESFEKALKSDNVEPFFKFQRLYKLTEDSIPPEKFLGYAAIFSKQYPESLEGHLLYSQLLNQDNQPKEAKKEALKVLKIDTAHYYAHQYLILSDNALLHYDSLLIHAEKAIQLYPNDPWFRLLQGFAFTQTKKYDEAKETLLKGKELVGGTNENLRIQFLSSIADNYYKQNDVENAFKIYDEILFFSPDNILILNNYAYYLSLRNERLEKAEEMSRKCIEQEPENSTYLDTYAWVLYKMENYEDAKKYQEQAIEYENKNNPSGVVWEHYGDILFQFGEKEKAIEIWMKAIELGSDDDELLKEKIEEKQLIEK